MSLIEKVKDFLKKIFSKKNVDLLQEPNEKDQTIEKEIQSYKNDKKEIFGIYQEIKKKNYDLTTLNERQSKKITALLEEELKLKKENLDKKITELNILKYENEGLERKLNKIGN